MKKPIFPPVEERNQTTITRKLELKPYFVFSNNRSKIIGSIYLSEEQAYQLNTMMKHDASQDIVFLEK